MRLVVQRVLRAEVRVGETLVGSIEKGLLVFLGVGRDDDDKDLEWMIGKVIGLRVFEDEEGRMNRSVREVDGSVLVISQFTLFGNLRKGSRPSFNRAADPDFAEKTYQRFLDEMGKQLGYPAEAGQFGADMQIEAINDGPVTLIVDSREKRF